MRTMSDSGGSAERVVLRGGYESRLILALVAVVFLTAAIDLLSSPGDDRLPGVLLVLSPVVVLRRWGCCGLWRGRQLWSMTTRS